MAQWRGSAKRTSPWVQFSKMPRSDPFGLNSISMFVAMLLNWSILQTSTGSKSPKSQATWCLHHSIALLRMIPPLVTEGCAWGPAHAEVWNWVLGWNLARDLQWLWRGRGVRRKSGGEEKNWPKSGDPRLAGRKMWIGQQLSSKGLQINFQVLQ